MIYILEGITIEIKFMIGILILIPIFYLLLNLFWTHF